MNKSRRVALIFVLFAFSATALYWVWPRDEQTEFAQRAAPAFSLPNEKGELVSLASFSGKPLLLHFWANWCPPCLEELPALLDFAKTDLGTKIQIVSISLD